MLKLKVYIFSLFCVSAVIAGGYGQINVEMSIFLPAFFIFLFFSFLYSHTNLQDKKGKVTIDYGLAYGLAFVLFAGPAGAFLFETVYRFLQFSYRSMKKTGDKDELLHTFYNIGAFSLFHSAGYFFFYMLYPIVEGLPFGFWLLLATLVIFQSILSDTSLAAVLYISGEINSKEEIADFYKSRSLLDMGKTLFSNGLLAIFLIGGDFDMVIALFLLNYMVTRSLILKSQTVQHKIERDKFEEMAYTDYLTKTYNRAYMSKVADELRTVREHVAVVVADIDDFKRINDTFNHHVGDQVIRHVADTFTAFLHPGDYLFRSGGEEFTLFLRGKSYQECMSLMKEIQLSIGQTPAKADYHSEDLSIYLTCSFGMFFFETNCGTDMKNAYIRADDLLLHSKSIGKNRLSAEDSTASLATSGIKRADEILPENLPNSS
ncbi:GGDEF domain-containing protein [Virgibacillus sediminis]|uniref:GGDEF domain-containing protein n=1 Tax=Virgibacillus sediminis TaxID=202260 RepID=A0ABV7A7T2_9BACI